MATVRALIVALSFGAALSMPGAEAGVVYRGMGEGVMPDGTRLSFDVVALTTGPLNDGTGTAEITRPGAAAPTRFWLDCFAADFTGYGFIFRGLGPGEDGRLYHFAGNSQNYTFAVREIASPQASCEYINESEQTGLGSFQFEMVVR